MKFKYIIPAFIAVVAALFTGCSENNDPTYLSEIRVSQSYVGIPAAGGRRAQRLYQHTAVDHRERPTGENPQCLPSGQVR